MQTRTWIAGFGALAFGLFTAGNACAQNPYAMADESWISISGTVASVVSPSAFTLDYGEGIVTVEMDDWDLDADAYKLIAGDDVTVTGRIDDDLFETTTIEASSVYVDKINTYFYASAADEEDTFVTLQMPFTVARTVVQGEVTRVGENEFGIDAGPRMVTVNIEDLGYDPLDAEGFQRIEKGDRVSVVGMLDVGFFGNQEIEADAVVELDDDMSG